MITFLDENDIEHGAQTTIKSTNAVNGERSLSGEIVTGDYVISHIERGWRLRFNDEYYVVTYAKPIDEGRTVSVTFDAVHQFFWDFDKSSLHRQLSDGSHTFQAYLDFIFEGSGYSYVIDSLLKIPAFEKQSFGYKSRLSLFNDIVTSTGVEFQVNGKVVRILVKVGTDLSTVVRKNFNLNELGIEKNIGDFVTYQKGFGAWNDSEDHNKGRLEVEYTSPLASIYGKLEAEPLVDERYTKESSLLSVLKNNVDNSYTISVTLDIEDLTRAGYKYTQPIAGDYIMAINETLSFQEKIRIVSFTSEYDVTGQLIKHTVTCNDIGFVKKQSASYSVAKKQASSAVSSAQNALEVANRALVSANGKNSIFRGTDFPKDEPKGALHVGDLLFLTVGDVVKQYRWNGADWEYITGEDYAKQIKEQVDSQFAEVTQQITEQQQAHDRTVAEILAQAESTEAIAQEAKRIGDQAKADAVNLASQLSTAKTALQNSINDTKSQIATVSQALSTAKSDLQTQVNAADAKAVQAQRDITQAKSDLQSQASQLITQAAKQAELTKLTTETKKLADGTLTSLNELSKTVDKNTGNITSVANRTKTVEDTLSGVKINYAQLNQTVNTQTGQIESINRKTADLQSGIDSVTERFENLRVGQKNLILNSDKIPFKQTGANTTIVAEEDYFVLTSTGYTANSWGGVTWDLSINSIKAGEEFSLLLPVYLDSSVSNDAGLSLAIKNHKLNLAIFYKGITGQSDKWFDFVVTFKANRDLVLDGKSFYLYFTKNGKMRFKKPILVSGNVIPSDWSPADEDTAQQIAEYKRTADQNYSGLQSTISTLDGKITQNKSEQVQTADAIKTRLTSLETYKNAEDTRAQAYFEAAKTETAKQITAERTAIANNYVAKSTYQEDANGITRRLTATETVANNAATKIATYQETNDRRVAALETAKSSTDGTLTQLSNKVEQNAQQTRETISAVESKIPTDFGGDNLILEGDRQEAGKYWNNTDLFTHSFYYSGQKKLFRLQTSSASEITTSSNRFPVKRNTKYSLSFWTFSAGNVSSFDVWFLGRKAGETNDFTSPNLFVGAHKNSPVSAEYVTATFNSGNNDEGYIRFDNNGSSDGNNALFAFGEVMLVEGTIPKHFSKNVAEVATEISNAKLDITKTAEGLKLTANKVEGHDKSLTQHTTQITALNNELAAKVSKTEYNELAGRVTGTETNIRVQAGEISKRLTSTQVESAITAKGYQTKAQVDSNIAGRGYITSSALQPYATTTVLENKVRETVDSFNRTISAVRLEIPTNASMRNLILKSSDKWGAYTSTNNANSNWCPEICRITLDSDRGISVGKKLNLFVYISANNVTLDTSSNHTIAIQAAIVKADGTNLWHADVPFHGQWVQNLNAGNNYYVIKLTNEIKETAYENGATLIVQCRIDGANHVDFHHRAAMITTGDMFPDTWYPAPEDMATVVAFNKVSDTVDRHTQTLKDQEGRINTVLQTATTAYQLLQSGGSIYEDLKTVKGQIQQVRDANYATRIETLAGSWAVKNLTSGGQMLNQFNLLANGINHIDGRLTHITGDTLIDRGVIKSAMIGNGQIGTAHIGTIDASQANIINLNVNKLVGFDATFIKGKFDNVIADLLKGKTVAAQNGAMNVDLLNAKINLLADSSAIRRVFNGYPTQFIKYGTMIDSNGNKFSKTIIGSNRDGSENSGNATFSGIEIFNSATTSVEDYTKIYADKLYLKHDGGDHGWLVQTSNKQRIIPLDGTIPSEIMAKDFLMIYNDNGNATSLRDHIAAIVHNITELANRTGGMTNIWSIKA